MKQNSRMVSLEVIAPPKTWQINAVRQWTATVARILDTHGISRLNLPEVADEARREKRTVPFLPKMNHVRFGNLVRKQQPTVILIPHKRCVRVSPASFARWVQKVHDKRIRHIVVVGGESHRIAYKGFSVLEAAAFIKEHVPNTRIGGITIFTRKNEVERIVAKVKSGITFFLSQIIFETANMKQVLTDLKESCAEKRLEFPDVHVSLAPAAKIRDIEFMQWLGVKFPPRVLHSLVGTNGKGVESRTFEVLERLIDDLFNFTEKEKLGLGFNIGHVVYDNLDLSERLIELVSSRADA